MNNALLKALGLKYRRYGCKWILNTKYSKCKSWPHFPKHTKLKRVFYYILITKNTVTVIRNILTLLSLDLNLSWFISGKRWPQIVRCQHVYLSTFTILINEQLNSNLKLNQNFICFSCSSNKSPISEKRFKNSKSYDWDCLGEKMTCSCNNVLAQFSIDFNFIPFSIFTKTAGFQGALLKHKQINLIMMS